jgi:hypothetical protein
MTATLKMVMPGHEEPRPAGRAGLAVDGCRRRGQSVMVASVGTSGVLEVPADVSAGFGQAECRGGMW